MDEKNDLITRSFPPEITGCIFENYIDLHKEPIDETSERITTPRAALTLGAVCRNWRAIAWSSHRLWTSLSINLLSAGHAHGPGLVQQWFQRTGRLPVSIRIRQDITQSKMRVLRGQVEADAKSVMRILDSFSAKIISLDLRDVPLRLASLLTTPSAGSVLQTLRVGESEGEESITEDTEGQLFGGVGTKHSPATLIMKWPLPPSRYNIQWPNLTDLRLEHASRAILFEAIRLSAPCLECLMLSETDGFTAEEANWLPPRPVELPELSFLSYDEIGSSQGTCGALFNHIRVPSLLVLEYRGYEPDNYMPIPEIIECIQRSACNIIELRVHEALFHKFSDLLPLLRQTAGVQTLDISLESYHSIEPLLQELQYVPDQPLLLPLLFDLKLFVCKTFEWMSFAKIWLADESFDAQGQYVDERFAVREERMDLEACMTLRDARGKVYHLTPPALLALMKINNSVEGGVTIRQQDDNDLYSLRVSDLLEKSRKHYLSLEQE